MRWGKFRKVHMGTPWPSAALPPSRYVFVLWGTTGSTCAEHCGLGPNGLKLEKETIHVIVC